MVRFERRTLLLHGSKRKHPRTSQRHKNPVSSPPTLRYSSSSAHQELLDRRIPCVRLYCPRSPTDRKPFPAGAESRQHRGFVSFFISPFLLEFLEFLEFLGIQCHITPLGAGECLR